jgi:hypothetical protein
MHDTQFLSRRRLLASAAALALPKPLLAEAGPLLPEGRRKLSFHIVDGWVLTSHDLDPPRRDAR